MLRLTSARPLTFLFSIALIGGTIIPCGSARAQADELREFAIKVDNNAAGKYLMRIKDTGDDTTTVECQADVKVGYLVYTYEYNYRGTEVWKNGRLQRLQSKTTDDGKRFSVQAVAGEGKVVANANGKRQAHRGDVWVTSYWHLPDESLRNRQISLIDADTGRSIVATLRYVNEQRVRVGGAAIDCTHYRLDGGGLQVELWYDAQERLVREEAVEDGHKQVFELAKISR